jgi:hypothetical protein
VKVKYIGVGKSSDTWKVKNRHMAETLTEILHLNEVPAF